MANQREAGNVKWFNVKNGYEVITRNSTREDIFVHKRANFRNYPHQIKRSEGESETADFDVIVCDKGQKAIKVTGL